MPKFFKPAVFIIFVVIIILMNDVLFCEHAVATERLNNETNDDYFYYTIQSNVSKIHIIESGKEKIIDNNQNKVLNISIDRKKIDNLIIKIDYEIIIKNIGNNEIFLTELQDYMPDGLTFYSEDNIDWIKSGNILRYNGFNYTITKPGEIEKVHIIFRWDNNKCNLGIKNNYAEVRVATNVENNNVKNLKFNYNNLDNNKFTPIIITNKSTTTKLVIVLIMSLVLIGILAVKYIDTQFQLPRMRRVRYITQKIQKV